MTQENDNFCIPEYIQKMSLEEIRNEKEKLYKEIMREMRDATSEERQSVQKYIEKISKPTGVNFYDFFDKEIEVLTI